MSADEKTQLHPPPNAVAVGTQLSGTYELDQRLASGGMGEVYRGHNIQTGDPVAIKIVLPEFARDQTILSLFRKEASILNHLFHEAIVRYHVFAIDQAIGRPYLAMEYVDGTSLVDMFAKGPMNPADARTLLIRLASGLAVAHEAGVIHRDLSPDNIVLPGGKVERAKIIDFGIARSSKVGGETLIGGSFAGKYNFVSPEQLGLAGGEITERSDIYSLGLVIAAALRGGTINMTGTQVDIVEKRRVVPDLTGLDPSMRPVIEAMLQPDPKNRPPTMASIVAMLQRPAEPQGVWDVPSATTTPPAAALPSTQAPGPVTAYPQPAPEEQWPPETSRTPAPWRTEAPATPAQNPAGASAAPVQAQSEPAPLHATSRQKSSGLGIGIAAVLALAVAGAGGGYLGGYFDAFLKPAPVDTPPSTAPETPADETPPADATPPSPEPAEEPAPEPAEQPAPEPVRPEPEPVQPEPVQPEPVEPAPPEAPVPTPPVDTEPPADQDPPAQPTPPVDEPPADQPETPPPAQEPSPAPAPDPAVDRLTQRLDWVKAYSGGDCFFATANSDPDGALMIEGYGSEVKTFESLLTDFGKAFASDPEPDIGVRLIQPKQCAIPDFLRSLQSSTIERPRLTMARDVLFNGDPMTGDVELAFGRETYLILVDHDGIVHNLMGVLQRTANKASFNVALGLGPNTSDNVPKPQVLIAFSTSASIETMRSRESRAASDLLPAIAAEIASRGLDAAVSARYFRIRR